MKKLDKMIVAKQIKNIGYNDAINDFQNLKEYEYRGTRSLIGTRCTNYFTFINQLDTIGNKGVSFWDFFNNLEEYRKKPYINNFLINNEHHFTGVRLLYECFKLYFGSIGSFYSSTTASIIKEFNPTHIIDPFAGFGGRLIGAMSCGVSYTGFDTNTELYPAYKQIITTLIPLTKDVNQNYNITIKPSETVDYSQYDYDMVLTSPPYYGIEVYNGTPKRTKADWNTLYRTVFKNAYDNMKDGGCFILSINDEMYNKVCVPLLGECCESIEYVKSRSGRYSEMLYVWIK